MDTVIKTFLLLLFISFLLSNARADKTVNDESMFNTDTIAPEPQYSFVLPEG